MKNSRKIRERNQREWGKEITQANFPKLKEIIFQIWRGHQPLKRAQIFLKGTALWNFRLQGQRKDPEWLLEVKQISYQGFKFLIFTIEIKIPRSNAFKLSPLTPWTQEWPTELRKLLQGSVNFIFLKLTNCWNRKRNIWGWWIIPLQINQKVLHILSFTAMLKSPVWGIFIPNPNKRSQLTPIGTVMALEIIPHDLPIYTNKDDLSRQLHQVWSLSITHQGPDPLWSGNKTSKWLPI